FDITVYGDSSRRVQLRSVLFTGYLIGPSDGALHQLPELSDEVQPEDFNLLAELAP
ncbi:18432_t:CDS:1, partial [Gigaspora rosea]